MNVDILKSLIDALLIVSLTFLNVPLMLLTTPSTFFDAPWIVLENP
jgi:hypothetical protein